MRVTAVTFRLGKSNASDPVRKVAFCFQSKRQKVTAVTPTLVIDKADLSPPEESINHSSVDTRQYQRKRCLMATELTELLPTINQGEIILFPSATGATNIERCAHELDQRHGAEAITFWKAECRKVADELLNTGMSESDVHQRVMRFQEDVQSELVIRHQKRALVKSRRR